MLSVSTGRPAIVQGDRTVLLEVDHARYEEGRDILSRFAELERSPEHGATRAARASLSRQAAPVAPVPVVCAGAVLTWDPRSNARIGRSPAFPSYEFGIVTADHTDGGIVRVTLHDGQSERIR